MMYVTLPNVILLNVVAPILHHISVNYAKKLLLNHPKIVSDKYKMFDDMNNRLTLPQGINLIKLFFFSPDGVTK